MSEKINFLAGTQQSFRDEFKERLKYKKLVNFEGLIDTWYTRFGYGVLTDKYEPAVLINDPSIIKQFPDFANEISALNFVTDSFVKFRKEYLEKINNSTLGFPPFLDGLIPKSGYLDFEEIYGSYLSYSIIKYSSFLESNKEIKDFSSFLCVLTENLLEQLQFFPVTKSGYVLSRHNDIKSTGLVIELAKLDYNLDFNKGELVQSPDFQCYLELAASNGFFVDKNAPWRMMADLDSTAMKSQIRSPNASLSKEQMADRPSTRRTLDSIYRVKTHYDDLFQLQDFVVKTYNEIKKGVPFLSKIEYNRSTNKRTKKRTFRPEAAFLSTEEWLSLLISVRFIELGMLQHKDFKATKEEILSISRIYGIRQALGKLGEVCSLFIKEIYVP
jgi:hypothetical protein